MINRMFQFRDSETEGVIFPCHPTIKQYLLLRDEDDY